MDNYEYVVTTVIAIAISYALCGVLGWLALRIGFVDAPNDNHKKHKQPTPLLGGVAVLTSLVLLVWTNFSSIDAQLELILISTGCMCLLGLIDDRWNLAPRTKFAGQVIICLPAAWVGFPLATLNGFGLEFAVGSFAPVLILLWLTTCANAVNLLDGLDGVVGLVGVAICGSLAGIALVQPNVAALSFETSLWLAACLLGFLVHNWCPARLYLGDAGSLSIGLLLGMLALRIETNSQNGLNAPVLLMLFAVPLADMTFAMTRRIFSGRSIASPDNEHLHHRFHAFGLRVPHAAIAAFLLSSSCGIAAFYSVVTGNAIMACIFCIALFIGLAVFGMFGDIEARLAWMALRRWVTPSNRRVIHPPNWVSINIRDTNWEPTVSENSTALGCVFSTSSNAEARILVVLEADSFEESDVDSLASLLKLLPQELLVAPPSTKVEQRAASQFDPVIIPFDSHRLDVPNYQKQSAA